MARAADEPGTIILDMENNPPTLWVVKSKTKLLAVLDDGSVLDASYKGVLWGGAKTINNRQLAADIKLRFGHGVGIGDEWITEATRLKVVDLRRDRKAILEVLEKPETSGWRVGMEITLPIKGLTADYRKVPRKSNEEESDGDQ